MKLKPKFGTSSFDRVLNKLEKTIKRVNRSKSNKGGDDEQSRECVQREEVREDREHLLQREIDIDVAIQRVESDMTAVPMVPSLSYCMTEERRDEEDQEQAEQVGAVQRIGDDESVPSFNPVAVHSSVASAAKPSGGDATAKACRDSVCAESHKKSSVRPSLEVSKSLQRVRQLSSGLQTVQKSSYTGTTIQANKSLQQRRKLRVDVDSSSSTEATDPKTTNITSLRRSARKPRTPNMFQLADNHVNATVSNANDTIKPRRTESLFGASMTTVQQARKNEKSLLEATIQGNEAPKKDEKNTSTGFNDTLQTSLPKKPPQSPRLNTSNSCSSSVSTPRQSNASSTYHLRQTSPGKEMATTTTKKSLHPIRKSSSDTAKDFKTDSPTIRRSYSGTHIDTTVKASRPPLPRSKYNDKSPKTLIDDLVCMYENGLMSAPSFNSVSSTRSATPNDVIWRAYSTAKSLGHFISFIVMAQSAARRWLAVRELKRLKDEKLALEEKRTKEESVTVITANARRYLCQRTYKRIVRGVLLLVALFVTYLTDCSLNVFCSFRYCHLPVNCKEEYFIERGSNA